MNLTSPVLLRFRGIPAAPLLAAAIMALGIVPAQSALMNGGFETGDFTSWTLHSDTFFPPASSIPIPEVGGAGTPLGGVNGDPAQTPIEGSYHAVVTNGSGTASAYTIETSFLGVAEGSLQTKLGFAVPPNGGAGIKQSVTLNVGERIRFRYALAYEDKIHGPKIGGSAEELAVQEESAFFMLLRDGVTGDENDIIPLGPIFTNPTPGTMITPDTIGYTTNGVFISAPVSTAGTYKVVFGTTLFNNSETPSQLNHLMLLVDNVSVTSVPEPSAMIVFGAFVTMIATRRQRRKRPQACL